MPITKIDKNLNGNTDSSKVSLNQSLREATAQLTESKSRSAKLPATIKYFARQRKVGELFPVGDNSMNTDLEHHQASLCRRA
jgi:hypothetical protein